MINLASVAAQLGGSIVAITQPAPADVADIILLPSDGLERARPRILISNVIVSPGPAVEALMRSAAYLATEHKYDI